MPLRGVGQRQQRTDRTAIERSPAKGYRFRSDPDVFANALPRAAYCQLSALGR